MKQNEVLAEANKLVTNGLRKAAIDLLREYLDTDPDSTKVLSTLGRAYLLDRQPEKAVVYLKRSLEISQRSKIPAEERSDYRADEFGADDMEFVDAQKAETLEHAFDFEEGAPPAATGDVAGSVAVPDQPDAVVVQEPDEVPQISADFPATPTGGHRDPEGPARSGALESREPKGSDEAVEEPIQIDIDDVEVTAAATADGPLEPAETGEQPFAAEDPEPEPEPEPVEVLSVAESDLPSGFEAGDGFDLFDEGDVDVEEDPEEGLPDLGLGDITLVDDSDELEDAIDPGSLFDDLQANIPVSLEDDAGDLSLDDLEGLDEFDALANRIVEDETDEDAVTREQRARQIAVEVLAETDWEPIHLSLLQDIFFEKGWSATRKALEVAISDGLSPEELSVAREIRILWEESEQYWITFHKIKSNVSFCQADAAYKHMSWLEAIRIVRCFPDIPDTEEVYDLIEEAYEQWYNSGRLRRTFKAFFKFLRYRTSLMRRASRGRFALSLNESAFGDAWIDSGILGNVLEPESQRLYWLGLNLYNWPRPPDNKMKIIRAHLEQGQKETAARVKSEENEQPIQQSESTATQKPAFGFGSSIWQGTERTYEEQKK